MHIDLNILGFLPAFRVRDLLSSGSREGEGRIEGTIKLKVMTYPVPVVGVVVYSPIN